MPGSWSGCLKAKKRKNNLKQPHFLPQELKREQTKPRGSRRKARAATDEWGPERRSKSLIPAERLLWPGRASPSASQLLAFSPGKEQAAGEWETCLAPGWPQLRSRPSRFDAWDRVLRAGALGRSRGMEWGGRRDQALEYGLSNCGTWALLPCGMLDLPGPGISLKALALEVQSLNHWTTREVMNSPS